MKKLLRKLIHFTLAGIMAITLFQGALLNAKADQLDSSITYNVHYKQVPFIYCNTSDKGVVKLTNGNKEIPKNTYSISVYVINANIDIKKDSSSINVNGQKINPAWGSANDSYYTQISFSLDSSMANKVEVNLDYNYKSNFSVRARKIFSGKGNLDDMEAALNKDPALFQLYNEDKSILLNGTINTATDSSTNFVHWKAADSNSYYVDTNDTYIKNLPNGTYTVIETYAGGNLNTINQTSTSVWLKSSMMKFEGKKAYYTFTVNDNTINEWMKECIENRQSSSLFYGFYSESNKPKLNVNHNVLIKDNTIDADDYLQVDSKTTEEQGLAYSQEDITRFANNYLKAGYMMSKTEIEVKKKNGKEWTSYQEGMKFYDGDTIRYVITIDKDLSHTKTLRYSVEHWIDGENTARDIEEVSEQVWINDTTTTLLLQEIQLKQYDGYDFKGYMPTILPKTVEDGAIIKVVYSKTEAPVEPVNPQKPVIPISPITPTPPPSNPVTPVVVQEQPIYRDPTEGDVNNPEVKNDDPQKEVVKKDETPLAKGNSSIVGWALLNLICASITVIIAVMALVLKREKEEDDCNAYGEGQKAIYQRKGWKKIVSALVAVLSVILFALTENMALPMMMVDEWTIFMVMIAVLQVLIYFYARHWKQQENEETAS